VYRERQAVDFDWNQFVQASNKKPCFICRLSAGDPNYPHQVLFQDDFCIAFLDKYPRQYGHTLIAPKMHREHVLADFAHDEYLRLQSVVYRVGRALQSSIPTERLYVICYGSQQGFSHVHWQLVPLPPGVPFEQQQGFATNPQNGIVHLSEEEMCELAARIQTAL
jgi:diadenosine tetraphosphate (Ap4A) HIT family hydrolase